MNPWNGANARILPDSEEAIGLLVAINYTLTSDDRIMKAGSPLSAARN
jgi:hypothetical protein